MVKYLGLEMKFKPSCGDRLESGSARVLLLLSSEDVFWKPTDAVRVLIMSVDGMRRKMQPQQCDLWRKFLLGEISCECQSVLLHPQVLEANAEDLRGALIIFNLRRFWKELSPEGE